METLIGSSAWKMVCDYIQKLIDIEQEDINRPASKELNKEQRELLHERQESQKLVMEAYNKILTIPESIIQDNTGSWNFTVKMW